MTQTKMMDKVRGDKGRAVLNLPLAMICDKLAMICVRSGKDGVLTFQLKKQRDVRNNKMPTKGDQMKSWLEKGRKQKSHNSSNRNLSE